MLTCTYCGAVFEAKYQPRHLRECAVYKKMQLERTSSSTHSSKSEEDTSNVYSIPQVLLSHPTDGDMMQERIHAKKLSQKRKVKSFYLPPPLEQRKTKDMEPVGKRDITSLINVGGAKEVPVVKRPPLTPPNSPMPPHDMPKFAWSEK